MTTEEKIRKIEEVMEVDEGTLDEESILSDYEEWDSLTILSFLAMADMVLNKTIDADKIKNAKTVKDLIRLF